MSRLKEARAKIMDVIGKKHLAGELTWNRRESENSFDTWIDEINYHIDRKVNSSGISYKLWIFDKEANEVDSFDPSYLDNDGRSPSTNFKSFKDMAALIYREGTEMVKLAKLNPILESLRTSHKRD